MCGLMEVFCAKRGAGHDEWYSHGTVNALVLLRVSGINPVEQSELITKK